MKENEMIEKIAKMIHEDCKNCDRGDGIGSWDTYPEKRKYNLRELASDILALMPFEEIRGLCWHGASFNLYVGRKEIENLQKQLLYASQRFEKIKSLLPQDEPQDEPEPKGDPKELLDAGDKLLQSQIDQLRSDVNVLQAWRLGGDE